MKRRRALLLALLAALAAARGGAQGATAAESLLNVNDVDTSSHPEVRVVVTAPQALVGTPLGVDHFAVFERGQRRKIDVKRLPSDALEVVVVVDTSGSMKGEAMGAAKAAATQFVEGLPSGARVSVVGFGSAPEVAAPMGTSRSGLASAIGTLEANGETALYDAIVASVAQFGVGQANTRRYVVVLSDGADTVSGSTLAEAGTALKQIGAGFYAIALATSESDGKALKQLAATAGGEVASAARPSELAAVYGAIAGQLVNQYAVTYTSQSEGPTDLNVSVAANGVVAQWTKSVTLPPLPEPAPPPPEPAQPYLAPGPGWLEQRWMMLVGIVPLGIALAIAGWQLTITRQPRRRLARELGFNRAEAAAVVSDVAGRATDFAERMLAKGGRSGRIDEALERAGLPMRSAEFVTMVGSTALGLAVVSLLVAGPLAPVPVAGVIVGAAVMVVRMLATRRRQKLADQLGDTLQLLAGTLRSGQGLIQAIHTVTREMGSPTAEEWHRVIVETRLGRDVSEALDAMAERAGSEDLDWVVQAIRIHREVGGDLAEVLDRVGETIRDRNRVRGQVKSLTAEGRLSAIILMALPFLVGAWMYGTNKEYVSELWTRPAGRMVSLVGVVLMSFGAVVMRRLVRPEF